MRAPVSRTTFRNGYRLETTTSMGCEAVPRELFEVARIVAQRQNPAVNGRDGAS